MSLPLAALSPSGTRLHLQHGPIDLIVTAHGPASARAIAFRRAEGALQPVLADLVAELGELRRPACDAPAVRGAVARRMVRATAGYGGVFITPMAAVAGAVADHVVSIAMQPELDRLTVNNGGDIAFALGPGASTTVGVADGAPSRYLAGSIRIHEAHPVRGIATSGWRGRSHSLGIADAVTVLASDGAAADAAASAIASAVDLPGHPAIERIPADALQSDSDLGSRLVTVSVGRLSAADRRAALARGEALAARLLDAGRIHGALLVLGDEWSTVEHRTWEILAGGHHRPLTRSHVYE